MGISKLRQISDKMHGQVTFDKFAFLLNRRSNSNPINNAAEIVTNWVLLLSYSPSVGLSCTSSEGCKGKFFRVTLALVQN